MGLLRSLWPSWPPAWPACDPQNPGAAARPGFSRISPRFSGITQAGVGLSMIARFLWVVGCVWSCVCVCVYMHAVSEEELVSVCECVSEYIHMEQKLS